MSKRWTFPEGSRDELRHTARTHPKAYVRSRALALYHVASGSTAEEAAQMVLAHRTSVSHWIRAYLAQGLEGLYIAEGRGRQAQVDAEELDRYIRQSPRAFGIELNRWTLKALAQAVPSLKGLTEPGVKKALERYGYGYKRGQPHLHSPDPDYEQKKGLWTKR